MKEIPLTQGKSVRVSDEDFEYLNQWKWHAASYRGKFYAKRTQNIYGDGKHTTKSIFMHREIAKRINIPLTAFIDHIDRDGLNNCRENLRHATNKQNQENRPRSSVNYSGCLGVYWYKKGEKWGASLKHKGRTIHLGVFDKKEDAIKARIEGERKYYTHQCN